MTLRLAVSLERFGYLGRGTDGRYRLGPTLWRLGSVYRQNLELEPILRPALQALVAAMPMRRSAAPSSITPPSELIRPPSNAATTFLRQTAGKPKGGTVSSDMAGVARCACAERMVSTPNP